MAAHAIVRNICFAILFCFVFPPLLFAQTNANPEPETNNVVADANDPSDEIVQHINAMALIVSDNMDNPSALSSQIKDYLAKNQKAMNKASKAFESKVKKLNSKDAELYKETLQRKMEGSLENFLSLMLKFSERHPNEAKELETILKGDLN